MCKVVAVIIWVLGSIGSGMLGKTFETYSKYGGSEYNWGACITGLVSVL